MNDVKQLNIKTFFILNSTELKFILVIKVKMPCSATETIENIGILHGPMLTIMISRWQITKVLIRLCECTGWSAP